MNVQKWDALAPTFSTEVCDVVSLDRNDLIGSTLAKYGFSRNFGVALDAGCGVGSFPLRHASRFRRVTAFDSSSKLLERARQRGAQLSNVHWQYASIDDFAASARTKFDAIACFNVVTLPSPAKRARTLRALVTMLRPKGRLFLVVPALESINFVRGICHKRLTRNAVRGEAAGVIETDGFRQKHYSVAELRSVLSSAGGQVLELTPFTYPWVSEGLSSPRGSCRQQPWDWLCVVSRAR